MNPSTQNGISQEIRLANLEKKMDLISSQLQQLIDAKLPFTELIEEAGPIASEVMDVGIKQLSHLEQRGYFAFAKEFQYLVERLVEDYDPSDLRMLSDNLANILDTVRIATQPKMMATIRDTVEAFDDADAPKLIGAFGALRKIGGSKDIQRGIGFALDMLGHVGRSVSRSPRNSRSDGGSEAKPSLPAAAASDTHVDWPSVDQPTNVACIFVSDAQWNSGYASGVAQENGVAELTDKHMVLINFARKDFAANGVAPNIRRITTETGVSTREVYRLFPKAPGLTIAKVAGVPKPAGCL